MPIILAADTSTSILTVGLCRDDALLAEAIVDCHRKHSETLVAMTDWVLHQAGLTLAEVEALAISVGPGSFTGLRIGVATWKGLAFARDLPLAGVPTLAAMTRLVPLQNGAICTLLDARMKEVFGAAWRFVGGVREEMVGEFVGPVERILEQVDGDALFLGDGAALYKEEILRHLPNARFGHALYTMPRASAVALEGLAMIRQNKNVDAALVSPVYLRQSQAEVNRQRGAMT